MPVTQAPGRFAGLSIRDWTKKVVVFLVASLLLGWLYGWASPRVFPKEAKLGFGYGMLHGALMPMALPSLLMGQYVDIFAANNSGRSYKIGYICGINLCGLIFFGSAFWKPGEKSSQPGTQDREARHKDASTA